MKPLVMATQEVLCYELADWKACLATYGQGKCILETDRGQSFIAEGFCFRLYPK